MTFLNAVPPSAPLIPLSANIPNAVFNSTVPPAKSFAVPPTVNIPSPSCAILVFDFCDVLASWSTNPSNWFVLNPNADILSVTISEA